ncbi:MAG: hypothetical protein CMK06_07935 [Ponticaulis sp.]|nr:hypothetical protein [Ponticaulis sp.]MAT35059.1 hypothetical protein [Ponticaulis sp.]
MSFPRKPKPSEIEPASLQAVAPSPHMDALLRALEQTEQALEPMTSRGMDGRTAQILKEIEKTGAIAVHIDGDELWIDVIDRAKALGVIDKLINSLSVN